MGKVDTVLEQKVIQQRVGTLRRNQMERLEIKNSVIGMNASRVDWTWPRKESISLKMCQ